VYRKRPVAPTYTETNTSANSNMGYGGVKWTLGDSLVPELVAGYRLASVTNNGATHVVIYLCRLR